MCTQAFDTNAPKIRLSTNEDYLRQALHAQICCCFRYDVLKHAAMWRSSSAFPIATSPQSTTAILNRWFIAENSKGLQLPKLILLGRASATAAFPVIRCSKFDSKGFASSVPSISRVPRRDMAGLQPFLRVGVRDLGGAAPIDIEVFGKAATGTGSPSQVRGDCPFSQRILLDLEEKNVPYKATYIQEGNDKPDWFLEKNPSGLMPTLRDGDEWIQDSDKIAIYLEEKFPTPSLKTPSEYKNIGSGVFPAFMSYLKSKNPEDNTKGQLVDELKALEDHLKAHGPYIGGEKPTDSDYALIPKLKHLRISLKHYYDFEIPTEYSATHKYIELLESRPSFKKTDVPDKMIVEGWQKKFELPGRMVQAQTV